MGRTSAAINSAVLLAPIILGSSLAWTVLLPATTLLAVAAVLSATSVVLLLVSKLPKLRRGDLFSVGVGSETRSYPYYVGAYLTLAFAFSLWLSLALKGAA